MKKLVLLLASFVTYILVNAQLLTWSPQFPTETSTITVTVDATKGNQGLMGHTGAVYLHLGVITNLSNGPTPWKYVPTTWGTTTAPAATPVSGQPNKWTYTITNPRAYFNVPNGETIQKIAILFRDGPGNKKQANSDGSDMYIPLYSANAIQITNPLQVPTFNSSNETVNVTAGTSVPITAVSSVSGNLTLQFNGTQVAANTGTTILGNVTAVAGSNEVVAFLNGNVSDTFEFFVSIPTITKPLPTGFKQGINYYECSDSVTLVLYAPNKTSAMLIGDFPGSNWRAQTEFQMFKSPDGNYFWITVKGLNSGQEYAYQYLVDNTIYVADAYSEKILDPWSDKYINPNTYPNLKPYPTNSNVSASKNGIVSVLQICEPTYNWKVTNFTKPDKKNLIIYELLVRDFSRTNPPPGTYDSIGDYQTVIDSIKYLKRLGINAIELMPVQEFGGNNSWGYNPTFYFAPDKVYGTKNKLKELIDTLHANGMAVLLDVVYNHLDSYNTPIAKLYWDATNSRPAANNPWLNAITPHAAWKFFEDFNHTTTATQHLVNTSLEHWVKEYKIDGFRFDFTKGFTQTVTTNDNSAQDNSRINILNGYYDNLVNKYPNTYMILEHFCAPSEENILINKGFMTWREMFEQYKESIIGQTGNKNFGDVMWNYGANGRQAPLPGLVGFMGSHDKERLMYEALQNGANSGGYNVKNLPTALERMKAATAVLLTVPGPKMMWQFDEFGYDVSRGGNTDMRAPKWEYLNNPDRLQLLEVNQKIIKLRLDNPAIFNNTPTAYNFNANSGYVKFLQIGDPNINNTQLTIVANFGVVDQTLNISFQKIGNWSNFLGNGVGAGINGTTGTTFTLSNVAQSIVLKPGEYHIYMSIPDCTQPATPTASVTVQPTCSTPTGTVVVTAPSGADVQYSINGTNYFTSGTFTGLTPGQTYNVTAKFVSTNCVSAVRTVTVNALPSAPATPSVITTQPTCTIPSGTIVVNTPTGANIQYSINGTNYLTSGTFGNLTPGQTYNVTVKDNSTGCVSAIQAVPIAAVPAPPATPAFNVTQPTCPTPSGTITITSPTGTGLEYSINGSSYQTGLSFALLAPNSYSVTVKNTTNGCVSSIATATINAIPTAPTGLAASVTVQPTCSAPTGTIVVTAPTGVNLEYGLNGSNYQAGTTFSNLSPNTYVVTVRNTITQCVSNGVSLVVSPPPGAPATPTGSVTVQPTCTTPTGTIVITSPTGANIQYSVNGTNYFASGTFSGLAPNTVYAVTAKDVNSNCVSAALSLTVTAIPASPTIPDVTTTQPTCIAPTGTIIVNTPTGANIQYSINGTNYFASGTFGNLTPGQTYSVTAKDNATGCVSAVRSVSIAAIPAPPATPAFNVTNPTCPTPSGTIVVTAPIGTGLEYSINGINYQTGTTFTNLLSTNYSITVKNTVNGCISSAASATIAAVPVPPATPVANVTVAPTCSQLGTIVVTSPAGANFEYSLNGGTYQSSATFSSLTPNTYLITARNTTTVCTSSAASVTVLAPSSAPAAPVGLNESSITNSSVTLQWSVVSGASSYSVEYKELGTASWINIVSNTTNTSVNLSGLNASTTYDWRVRANCLVGNNGEYAVADFTTSSFSINNIKNGLGIMVYPNPASANSKIAYIVPTNDRTKIILYNSIGQKIKVILDQNSAVGQYELPLSDIISTHSKGTYYLQIRHGNLSNITKYIKP